MLIYETKKVLYYHSIWLYAGLPISEIDYPSITICGHGWIPSVTRKAMQYQFEEYLEKKGIDYATLGQEEFEEEKQAYLRGRKSIKNALLFCFKFNIVNHNIMMLHLP